MFTTTTTAIEAVETFRAAYLSLVRSWTTTELAAAFRAADIALHAVAGCLPEDWTDPRPGGGIVHSGPCPIEFARDSYAFVLAAEASGRARQDDTGLRNALVAALEKAQTDRRPADPATGL